MTAFLKSPLALTAVVLMGGAAFAGIMMTAYSGDEGASVPIVKAELGEYKVKPTEEGGMSVPYADSTVFDSMRSAEAGAPVENLLAPTQDELDNIESETDLMAMSGSSISEMDVASEIIDNDATLQNQAEGKTALSVADSGEAPKSVDKMGAENLLARVRPEGERAENTRSDAAVMAEAPAAAVESAPVAAAPEAAPAPVVASSDDAVTKQIRPAGSSPETLAYVRSVLDQKDGKEAGVVKAPEPEATASTAEKLNGVEPAAGMSGMASGLQGTHFVQLASVTDAAAAEKEWPKLQGKYTVLSDSAHRVQAADLGERGTFYRIQAGPFAESKAQSICDAIKAQNPGGCLVVRK